MDLHARIRRRQHSVGTSQIVREYAPISPVAHFREPVGRGTEIERLLDYVDPIFTGALPDDAYLWGPRGSGKSAIVTALFRGLQQTQSLSNSIIHTSTRAGSNTTPSLVYVDLRNARTEFGLYRSILAGICDDVPSKGVETERLRNRLDQVLSAPGASLLVALDHVEEPGTHSLEALVRSLETYEERLSWLAVGRTPPKEFRPAVRPSVQIELPAYREATLVDVLTSRVTEGLSQHAIEHEQLRRLAGWSDGDAHDGLCALFAAAHRAVAMDTDTIREQDLRAGMDAVPRDGASLGRVLALSENRRRVLRALVDCSEDDRASVTAASTAIAATPIVELSPDTVKRLLYELADSAIARRQRIESADNSAGRSPSRITPNFCTPVFSRLDDCARDPSPTPDDS